MRIILLVLLFTTSFRAFSQDEVFIRVYDLIGNKVGSGRITMLTDTCVHIQQDASHNTEFLLSGIGRIKTKRAVGYNMAIGAGACGLVFAVVMASAADPDDFPLSKLKGSAIGIGIGVPTGAVIGGIAALSRKPKTFFIQSSSFRWNAFRLAIGDKKEY
jgi:hypothetical protein